MNAKTVARGCAILFACALSACGGGGGGGDSGRSSDGSSISINKSSISLIALNAGVMTTEDVQVSVTGGKGTYYAAATADNDPMTFGVNVLSNTAAAVTVYAAQDIPPGTRHTGHVTYKLCSDDQCQHVTWSKSIPYTMTRYALATTDIGLTSDEGGTMTPVSLDITPPDTAHELTFESSDKTDVAADHTSPGSVVLSLVNPALAAGSYPLDIAVGFQTALSVASNVEQIPVTLVVVGDIVPPAIPALKIGAATTAASLSGSAPVSFRDARNAAWSAASDRDWLVLDTSAGTGAGSLAWHVDTTRLGAIANGSRDTAHVTVTSVGLGPVAATVTLDKQLPEVTSATPAGVLAGQPSTIQVTGRGFSSVTDMGSFTVGGVAATGGTIVSDTSATLQLPALPAGATTLAVANQLGLATRVARLGVTGPGTFTSTLVANSGQNHAIVYDASRLAIYASNAGTSTNDTATALVRYQLVGGAWQVTSVPVAGIWSLALASDRSTLYVESGDNLLEVDPDSLQVLASHPVPQGLMHNFYFSEPMPVTSDQKVWFGTLSGAGWFDPQSAQFDSANLTVTSGTSSGWGLYEPSVYGPSDGSALFVASCSCSSPTPPGYWMDIASGQVTESASTPFVNTPAFDAHGDVMLADSNNLYRTDTWAKLGSPTVTAGPQGYAGYGTVLSPDGTRIYREAATVGPSYQVTTDHLEVFDTTATVAGTSNFVSLGTIALPNKAVACNSHDTYFCDGTGRLAMDPAGTTLFWVGDAGLAVVPIPAGMQGVAAASRSHAQGLGRLQKAATAAPPRVQATSLRRSAQAGVAH
jgi:hypothetical protein